MAHANTEQLIAAWPAEDSLELLILRKMAATLIGGTSFSKPEELLAEAYVRCLDGRRSWPPHVPFSVFLGNVMRSIAHAERKAVRRELAQRVDFEEFMQSMQHVATTSSVEEELEGLDELRLDREAADRLRARLDPGDDAARKVLGGLCAGLSPAEVRESFHMDRHAFEATVKRLARRGRAARMH